ncbi:hypothetical protein [Parvularcula lutaonensis]|uniref:DUF4249 family protein n=1 Tax=Parvularcula lutaonensis TaxID=491923 RepID=A0ABV7MA13_9PROT|nr:hypothetical protein [Parvularcula lutaonensis]GGY36152.1 hypothetical protein GCM10007148_00350 [Parvularcula lutaonensis]
MFGTFRNTGIAAVALLGLTGCYEDLLDDEPGGEYIPGVSTTVTGVVAKGFAYCDVVIREPVGTALTDISYRPAGVVVGQNFSTNGNPVPQPTAADVRFTLTVNDYVGPAIIEASNCSYEDETTGDRYDVPLLRAPIDIPQTGGQMTVSVTPLSEMAFNVALARAGGVVQNISSRGVESGYRLVADAFSAGGQFDPMTTVPAIATLDSSANAAADEVFFGLVLAAFSGATSQLDQLYVALSDDLSAQGLRDFYDMVEQGAATFDQSGRNRTGQDAADVIAQARATALNPDPSGP